MRIAVFGKYPPIQGGVSSDVFEFTSAAANAGHDVEVFTNAGEVEPGFRCFLTPEDSRCLAASRVLVHSTSPLGRRTYIPFANPYLSKLLGAAFRRFKETKFDVVLGWYLEPYGVAAALVAQLHGLPHFVRTAGSDIGKLASHAELREAYSFSIQTAVAILAPSAPGGRDRYGELGARSDQIVPLRGSALPKHFRKGAAKLPLDWATTIQQEAAASEKGDRWIFERYDELNDATAYDNGSVTLGVFGKVGATKGTYDLLDALSVLSAEECRFNLLWMPTGSRSDLRELFEKLSRLKCTHGNIIVLPPVAPWRVPEFLALCDVTFVLERDFPVTFHSPSLPREIIACNSALVVSQEVASKQVFKENLISGRNCIIIPDPKDVRDLADAIRPLLRDHDYLRYVRRHGQYLSRTVEEFMDPGNNVLNALTDILSGDDLAAQGV